MGINYRQLKAHGKSIVLERQENIVIERNDNQLFKRKQTIVREKFPNPNDCDETINKQQVKRRRNKRGAKNENAALVPQIANVSESNSQEVKLAQTAKQLGKLAHEIDIEIEKLKKQRDLIMQSKPQSPLTKSPKRNAAIQNDMTWDQNLGANNSNIEFTIEKYSSQHKFVCTSPRYGRDEQTSFRPRMRTIGLQKNTNSSSGGHNHKKHEDQAAAKGIAAATAAAKVSAKEASLGGCFEYYNDGCLSNVLNVYHNHHTHGGDGLPSDSGCRKYCQRYNATGNYNGLVCNQKTYVETGVGPCSEYNYCCDEYTYDYPNSCYVPLSVCCGPPNMCGNCCTTCCNSRLRHGRSRSHRRRCTDLQTDDFARYKTSPTRREKSTTRKIEEEKLTKKYMIAITDELREHGDRSHVTSKKSKHRSSKSKERHHDDVRNIADEAEKLEKELREKIREESASKTSKYLTRGSKNARSKSDDDSDASSSLRRYKVKSKEKLLKITLTKQKQKHHVTTRHHDSDDDECLGYTPSQCSVETLRTLKKMRITAYRPSNHRRVRDEDTLAEREQKDSERKESHHYRDENDHRKKKESPRVAEETIKKRDEELNAAEHDEAGKVRKYAEYIDKYKQGPEELKEVRETNMNKTQQQPLITINEDHKIHVKQEPQVDDDSATAVSPTKATTRVPADFEARFTTTKPSATVAVLNADSQKNTQNISEVDKATPHAMDKEQESNIKRDFVNFSPETVTRSAIPPSLSVQENIADIQYIPQPQEARDVIPQPQGQMTQQQYVPLPRHVSESSDLIRPIAGTQGYSVKETIPQQITPLLKVQSEPATAYELHDFSPPTASSKQVPSPYDSSQIQRVRTQGEIYDSRRVIQPINAGGIPTQFITQPSPHQNYEGFVIPQPQAAHQHSATERGGVYDRHQPSSDAENGPYDRHTDLPSTSAVQLQQFIPKRQVAPKVEFEEPQFFKSQMGHWEAVQHSSYDNEKCEQIMQQCPQFIPQPQCFQYAAQKCEESRVYRDGKDVRFNICAASEQCYEDEELQCAEEREHEVEGLVNLRCDTFEIKSEYASARSSASSKRQPLISPKVPEFTGCPCMLETYLNLVATYSNGRQRRNVAQCAKKTINC